MAFGFKGLSPTRGGVSPLAAMDKVRLNSQLIRKKVDEGVRRALIKQAAFCTTTAKRTIKKANKSGASSNPGSPPKFHRNRYFKAHIFWAFDRLSWTSLSGPAQVSQRGVPRALEKGGQSTFIRKVHTRTGHNRRGIQGSRLTGGRVVGRQNVKPRPFMYPAMMTTLRKFPGQFRGVVRG